jgi:hypothetical protein
MRARPIEVFLPEDFRTLPFDEALRATDFLAAITGSVCANQGIGSALL